MSKDHHSANEPIKRPSQKTLKVMICGNVDDGKSTLLGRLLYDSNSLLDDQISGLKKSSDLYGHEDLNLAFITDGLKSERENQITIDVAYRFFATENRKFILIDSPGHFEYIANMATAASQAAVAVVLVDAERGLSEQTLRHLKILDIFSVLQIIFCINKMDLVGYSEARYQQLKGEIQKYLLYFNILGTNRKISTLFLPICALTGELVTSATDKISHKNMPWHKGPDLLTQLERTTDSELPSTTDFIFSAQAIFENAENFYIYGDILSGEVKNKDKIQIQGPTDAHGHHLQIKEIISDHKIYMKGMAVGLVFSKSGMSDASASLFKTMIKMKNQRLVLYKKTGDSDRIQIHSTLSLVGLMIQFNRAQKSTLKIGEKFIFLSHCIEKICCVSNIFNENDIFANIELKFDSVVDFIESTNQPQLTSGILIDPTGFNTVGVMSQVKAGC